MRRKKTPTKTTPPKRLQELVQKKCANQFKKKCELVTKILDDEKSTNATKLRALDLLGKYGGLLHATPPVQVAITRNIAEDLPKELLDQIEVLLKQQTDIGQSPEDIPNSDLRTIR